MTIDKILGISLALLPFVIIFIWQSKSIGVKNTFVLFGSLIFMLLYVFGTLYLLGIR